LCGKLQFRASRRPQATYRTGSSKPLPAVSRGFLEGPVRGEVKAPKEFAILRIKGGKTV
jgi:hypothetical protein